MTVILAILLSIAGLIVLLVGELPTSKTRRVTGWRARLVGGILLMTWPSLFLAGAIAGIAWELSILSARGELVTPDQLAILVLPYIDIYRVIAVMIVVGIALIVAFRQKKIVLPSLISYSGSGDAAWLRDVDIREAMHRLRLSEAEVRRLIRSGELKAVRYRDELRINGTSVNVLVHVLLALDFSKNDEFELAIRELDKAIALDPASARTYLVRGKAYIRLGQLAPARNDLERVLQLRPEQPEASDLLRRYDNEEVVRAEARRVKRVRSTVPTDPDFLWITAAAIGLFLALIIILGLDVAGLNTPCDTAKFDCARFDYDLTQIALAPTYHAQSTASANTQIALAPTRTAIELTTATAFAVQAPTLAYYKTQQSADETAVAPTQRAIAANISATQNARMNTDSAAETAVAPTLRAIAANASATWNARVTMENARVTGVYGSMTATVLYAQTKTAQRYARATSAALASPQPLPGKLILVNQVSGQVGTLDTAGTKLNLFSVGNIAAWTVAWSPDGQRLALGSRGPDVSIYIADANGSNIRKITGNDEQVIDPAWSPDGSRVAGVSYPATGTEYATGVGPTVLKIYPLTGTKVTTVYRSPDRIESPSWSSDGKTLVFCVRKIDDLNNYADLFTINADGSNLRPLTTNKSSCAPSWSPDGQHIAYIVRANSWHPDLYLMNADGSGVRELSECLAGSPNWSPDSSHIIFTGGFSPSCFDLGPGDQGIFIYDLDTDSLTRLKPAGFDELLDKTRYTVTSPSWGPE